MALKIVLQDVIVVNLYVEPVLSDCCSGPSVRNCKPRQDPQILSLLGKTVVEGNITFVSKKGIIHLGKDTIIKGAVIGGTIQPIP